MRSGLQPGIFRVAEILARWAGPPGPPERSRMHEILHEFPIAASPARVFDAVSTPAGLDQWWTARSSGEAREGAEYQLWFGPEYDWRARVTQCLPGRHFS